MSLRRIEALCSQAYTDVYDAKQYVKPVNDSWTQNAQRMNFQFTNSYGPSKDVVGISTRDIRVAYDNHQTQIIKILAKVKTRSTAN